MNNNENYRIEGDWVIDPHGNRAQISYWGSEVEAIESLETLVDCWGCINCWECVLCRGCIHCWECYGCNTCMESKSLSDCDRCNCCCNLKFHYNVRDNPGEPE